jgi:hypothetical protein
VKTSKDAQKIDELHLHCAVRKHVDYHLSSNYNYMDYII